VLDAFERKDVIDLLKEGRGVISRDRKAVQDYLRLDEKCALNWYRITGSSDVIVVDVEGREQE
jgi:hypothetical protein